jgi:hypothetical protein
MMGRLMGYKTGKASSTVAKEASLQLLLNRII